MFNEVKLFRIFWVCLKLCIRVDFVIFNFIDDVVIFVLLIILVIFFVKFGFESCLVVMLIVILKFCFNLLYLVINL